MKNQPLAGSSRIGREKQTIRAMIGMYCHNRHGKVDGLCVDCAELMDYAVCRLDRCPFGADKTACARCPVHCYSPAMRTRIKEVMRYGGPRMLWRHPILALLHWRDARRAQNTITRSE
jgi:hypothetical protein